jgi:hypothetical protein
VRQNSTPYVNCVPSFQVYMMWLIKLVQKFSQRMGSAARRASPSGDSSSLSRKLKNGAFHFPPLPLLRSFALGCACLAQGSLAKPVPEGRCCERFSPPAPGDLLARPCLFRSVLTSQSAARVDKTLLSHATSARAAALIRCCATLDNISATKQ